ncbi:ABC transporter permease [Nibribacter koreensis]|uniref:ABC transporter permease n=1 Tax=Nibribacter koreensis TaxID=1084519 RepID=UPI0031EBF931
MPIKSLIHKLLGLGLALWGTASVLFFLIHLLPSYNLPRGMDQADVTAYGNAASSVQQQVKADYLKRRGLDQPLFYFKISPNGLQKNGTVPTPYYLEAFIEKASKTHGLNATRAFLREWNLFLLDIESQTQSLSKNIALHAFFNDWALQESSKGRASLESRFLLDLTKTGQNRASKVMQAWHQLMNSSPQVTDLLPTIAWVGNKNQYHIWLAGIITGNLGTSTKDYEPVKDKLLSSLKVSASIALPATFVALVLSCMLAFWMSLPEKSELKTGITHILYALDSLPGFMITLGIFALYLILGGTLASYDALSFNPFSGTILLGSLSVVLFLLPFLTLFFQRSLLSELNQPYIRTAQAKGMSFRNALATHGVPNALASVTVVVADMLASLIAGVLIVEVTFSLPGTGSLLAHSLVSQDFATVIGLTLSLLLFRTTLMWLTEAANSFLDPRTQRV